MPPRLYAFLGDPQVPTIFNIDGEIAIMVWSSEAFVVPIAFDMITICQRTFFKILSHVWFPLNLPLFLQWELVFMNWKRKKCWKRPLKSRFHCKKCTKTLNNLNPLVITFQRLGWIFVPVRLLEGFGSFREALGGRGVQNTCKCF